MTEPKQVILRRAPAGGYSASPVDRRFLGGQFIPAADWETEKHIAKTGLKPLIEDLSETMVYLVDVYAAVDDALKLRTDRQMKKAITDGYHKAFMLGRRAAGNLTSRTVGDSDAINALRRDEYKYLNRFLDDVDANTGIMAYAARADYYGKAARELYWLGFARADMTRAVVWELGPTEHCKDCKRMSDKGYMSVPDLLATGLLPQSGKLECLGYHCQCRLEEKS